MKKISIILLDGFKLSQDFWSQALNDDFRFCVVGATAKIDDALKIVAARQPDIALIDLAINNPPNVDILTLMHNRFSHLKVIAIATQIMPGYAKKILQTGAMGYVTKSSPLEEIFEAIVVVMGGQNYLCEEVSRIMENQEVNNTGHHVYDMHALTQREIDVVQFIKGGLSSRHIAKELNLSLRTIEVHRHNILKKLKLNNTATLVNFINAHGL